MINIKSFGRLSSMFVRNRWEIIYILPSKQGWENGAFWRLRGVIHDLGERVGGFQRAKKVVSDSPGPRGGGAVYSRIGYVNRSV